MTITREENFGSALGVACRSDTGTRSRAVLGREPVMNTTATSIPKHRNARPETGTARKPLELIATPLLGAGVRLRKTYGHNNGRSMSWVSVPNCFLFATKERKGGGATSRRATGSRRGTSRGPGEVGPLCLRRQRSARRHRVPAPGISRHDDVVDDRDAKDASGRQERARGRDVLLARGRVAARMIVPVLFPRPLCGEENFRDVS